MEAKALLRAPPRGAELARIVDERIAAFPADTIGRLSGLYGTPGPSPVFVIGLPRSGTTLVSEILAAHDAVGNAGEIETMTYIAAKMRGAHPLAEMERALAEQGSGKGDGARPPLWRRHGASRVAQAARGGQDAEQLPLCGRNRHPVSRCALHRLHAPPGRHLHLRRPDGDERGPFLQL